MGNLIKYPFEITTRTANITTSKVIWNSKISTRGTRYMCASAGNFYLATLLDRLECMRIPIELVPQEFIDANNLASKIKNGYIYMKIIRGIYGLPQSGVLANKLLKQNDSKNMITTKSTTHSRTFHTQDLPNMVYTIVVDDFGVQYIGK